MERIDTKKLLLGILVIILPVLSISTSVYLWLESREVKGMATNRIEEVQRKAPYIVNIPPKVAYVGEEYIFVPKIVSEEGAIVELEFLDAPVWLSIDKENIVRGVPASNDDTVAKFVLKVSDGYNSTTLIEYLVIETNEEVGSDNN